MSLNQPRVPSGVRQGGEFTTTARTEPDVQLVAPFVIVEGGLVGYSTGGVVSLDLDVLDSDVKDADAASEIVDLRRRATQLAAAYPDDSPERLERDAVVQRCDEWRSERRKSGVQSDEPSIETIDQAAFDLGLRDFMFTEGPFGTVNLTVGQFDPVRVVWDETGAISVRHASGRAMDQEEQDGFFAAVYANAVPEGQLDQVNPVFGGRDIIAKTLARAGALPDQA